jgi:hypothetical protein
MDVVPNPSDLLWALVIVGALGVGVVALALVRNGPRQATLNVWGKEHAEAIANDPKVATLKKPFQVAELEDLVGRLVAEAMPSNA